jgi:hypothetical protein
MCGQDGESVTTLHAANLTACYTSYLHDPLVSISYLHDPLVSISDIDSSTGLPMTASLRWRRRRAAGESSAPVCRRRGGSNVCRGRPAARWRGADAWGGGEWCKRRASI